MTAPSPPLDSLAETAAWLIDIPSETGNEGRICTQIAARLLPVYPEPRVRRVGNSLVVGEQGKRPLVLLVGHIDTVPSQGQGPARVADGRLHGLGAADMKSGVAVMLHLLEDPLVRTGPYSVVGVFYDGEEGPAAGNGLEEVLRREPWLSEAVFAVVLEPSDGEIQLGCNGVVNLTVSFLGRSAHSARPWWGENAISKAGRWLDRMHRRQPESFHVGGLEFKEVMTVTRASGGIANNIVPARFDLNLNYRFNPSRSLEEAIEVARAEAAEADVVEVTDAAPAGAVEADHPLAVALQHVSGAALAPKQGWTDVARLAAHGIPAVNFGPGETRQAHQADESVSLGELESSFAVLRRLLAGQGESSTTTS